MANEEQLAILSQGVDVWNKWREENRGLKIYLARANLRGADLSEANLSSADLTGTNLSRANLRRANLTGADLLSADLDGADLSEATLRQANLRSALLRKAKLNEADLEWSHLKSAKLSGADLIEAKLGAAELHLADLRETNLGGAQLFGADFISADLSKANLSRADLREANLSRADLTGADFELTVFALTTLGDTNLLVTKGLDQTVHRGPSTIGTNTLKISKGRIPEVFLRGCGLSDWEVEEAKLYNPDLSNDEINAILYRMYELRATQALQISPLFISYSHDDSKLVDKIESKLNKKGVRFWRDIHDMKAGRMEKQIDRAIRQNPTVLLVLSEHSLNSDWVEHEVRTARGLEKELGRDTLCPVALDDSWKSSRWPKRIMEQIMEYNILDFSEWEDDSRFESTFNKLIDGLGLFYK